jgi:fucose permease
MVGRLINNRLLMRISPGPVLLASTVGATLCLSIVMLAGSPGVAGMALLMAGLFMSSIFPTALGVVSSRFPTMSGTALGLALTGGWLGSVAISPSFGFVAERVDYSTAYLVVVGAAGTMALATLLMLRQKTPAGAPAHDRRLGPIAASPARD